MQSFLDKLLELTDSIKTLKNIFFDTCDISYYDINPNSKYFVGAGYLSVSWGDTTEKQLSIQIELIELQKRLNEFLSMIEHKMPTELFLNVKEAQNKIHNWIHKKGDPPGLSGSTSKVTFDEELKIIEDFLFQLKNDGTEIVIVPDTNAIIQYPDPKSYFKVSSNQKFTFLILPTVLSELDNHKNFHKNPEFRTKIASVIKRLKGYRKQGDIRKGVAIEKKQIMVKMIETEPKFESLPSWLDKENKDDRIIASVLSFQINNLNSVVSIVTGDINMLNKASLAGISSFDNDDIV